MSNILTWGAKGAADYVETPIAGIPDTSLFALVQRGYRHVLGNEVAAKVSAYKKSEEGQGATDEVLAEKSAAWRQEALDKIMQGTLGVRVASAPRVSGIEALKRTIAVERIKASFAAYSAKTGKKLSLPTKDETVDYMGKPMTREDLIAAMLNKQAEAIEAEAKRRMTFDADEDFVG
jgi:hypothetical protein